MYWNVLASPQDSKNHDNVEIYTTDAFANQDDQLFSTVGFFLLPWWMAVITMYITYSSLIPISTDPILTSLVYMDVAKLLAVH